jgi:hypothetical protein
VKKKILLSAAIALLWMGTSGISGEAWAQTATARCGDGRCDPPETNASCPDDCFGYDEPLTGSPSPTAPTPASGGGAQAPDVVPVAPDVVPVVNTLVDAVTSPPLRDPELLEASECKNLTAPNTLLPGSMSRANRAALLIGVVLFLYVVFAWLFFKTMLERGAPIARTYGLTVSMILFVSYAMAFLCFFEMSFGPDWCEGLPREGWSEELTLKKGPFDKFSMSHAWFWIAGLVVVGGVSWILSMMPGARTSRARDEEAN